MFGFPTLNLECYEVNQSAVSEVSLVSATLSLVLRVGGGSCQGQRQPRYKGSKGTVTSETRADAGALVLAI